MIWVVVVLGSVGSGWLLGHGDVVANGRYAVESASQHLLTVMLGVTIGLYGRDRVRLRRAYASPSMAYAGKALFFASLSLACAWSFSPLDWPTSCLHASAAAGAVGASAWTGNLPPKL
jgi:peptidoglycan/LPS O-acetylase OafA/YrhL